MAGVCSSEWLGVLACPRCGGRLRPLARAGDGVGCQSCNASFPMMGRLPCLVPEPTLWRALWLSRLDEHQQVTQERIRFMHEESCAPALLARTRARLQRTIAAKAHERAAIAALFADLRQGALFLPSAGVPPLPENLGGRLAVLAWYENLFRDWAWGEREAAKLCRLAVEAALTAPAAGSGAPGCLAVYGAGAGRLAYDVHRALRAERTLAFDLNPLPLLVAERVVRGETVELEEFPVAPMKPDQVAVRQRLRAPTPVDDGLCYAFADAYQPPLAPGAVDLALTAWFIDIAGVDVADTAAALARVLRRGGRWINVGPLHFNTVAARNYLFDEVLELVERGGFRLLAQGQQRLPYFDSPVSGARREETVYWFSAERAYDGEQAAARRRPIGPAWLDDLTLPVPRTAHVAEMARTSGFTAMALSLIDGQRSIRDLSVELARMSGRQPEAMEVELRAFLAKLAGHSPQR